ncbi:hypothetical protein VTN49DRAFT_2776 [Thermomyces lanuginosus]|uniref:uncharacterized protein n=1 Tax=Thermomyces lanuginosus TaxID=5541 RepID=UPI003742A5D4
MPLDTIYLTRHGHRMHWTLDHKTGTYSSVFPTPTGNAADPTLTSHGVRQSRELAAHLISDAVTPKPWRVYSSPFYRCLQTIQPSFEALREKGIDVGEQVRIENGLGEWFGSSSYFSHPPPASPATLRQFFPSLIPADPSRVYVARVTPSVNGESIIQLHHRVAATLAAIIADVDAEIAAYEAETGDKSSKAILICSHAAPLIAMGRVLTGAMPSDPNMEDFHVFTAGLSTFVRRRPRDQQPSFSGRSDNKRLDLLAPGTKVNSDHFVAVPDWMDGKGIGGGWDCVKNGDCSFLSAGAERGWHFNGEESFDTGPMDLEQDSKL